MCISCNHRIFLVGERACTDGHVGDFSVGGMTFADFIFLTLSTVEKTNENSVKYWFRCLDLSGNGYLDYSVINHWYNIHWQRCPPEYRLISCEKFFAQLMDFVHKSRGKRDRVSLRDILRYKGASFIDILVNHYSFLQYQSGDSKSLLMPTQPGESASKQNSDTPKK